MKKIIFMFFALFALPAIAEWVTDVQNSAQYSAPLGTVADPSFGKDGNGKPRCNVKLSTGAIAPFRCKLVTISDPAPTPAPAPIPAPLPSGAQTPDSIAASKQVVIAFADPTNGAAMSHTVVGQRVRFMSPTGNSAACSVAAPCSPSQIFVDSMPGDLNVLRGGNYTANYGGNWGNRNFALGAAQSGIAIVGMPGEVAKLIRPIQNEHGNIELANGGSQSCPDVVANDPKGQCPAPSAAHNVTIAGLYFIGGAEAIGGGGYWDSQESGARGAVIVGNDITADYIGNTMTGQVSIQGDDCKIIGNRFHDFGTTPPINNNHALYIQTGADRCEVAFNRFENLRLGHVIQFHNDGTKRQVDNAYVHHNLIKGTDPLNMRGINFGDIGANSTAKVEYNIIDTAGQNFSAVAVYCGLIELTGNKFSNIAAGSSGKVWTGTAGSPCNPAPVIREKTNVITGGTGPDYTGNIVHQ